MEIPRKLRDAMVAHALEDEPNECCGLLSGRDGVLVGHYPMRNVARSPYRYEIDGMQLHLTNREIEDGGGEIAAVYHSHTHNAAYPSDTDIRLATWSTAFYLLLSLAEKGQDGQLVRKNPPELRAFRIVDGEVTEEPIVIV